MAGEIIDDVDRSLLSLQRRVFDLNKEMKKFDLTIATTLNTSKSWTVVSRILSGSPLWKLQNRIRSLVGIFDVLNQRQEKARENQLNQTKQMIELSEITKKLTDKRKLLDKAMKATDDKLLKDNFAQYGLLQKMGLERKEIAAVLEDELRYMEDINKEATNKIMGSKEEWQWLSKIAVQEEKVSSMRKAVWNRGASRYMDPDTKKFTAGGRKVDKFAGGLIRLSKVQQEQFKLIKMKIANRIKGWGKSIRNFGKLAGKFLLYLPFILLGAAVVFEIGKRVIPKFIESWKALDMNKKLKSITDKFGVAFAKLRSGFVLIMDFFTGGASFMTFLEGLAKLIDGFLSIAFLTIGTLIVAGALLLWTVAHAWISNEGKVGLIGILEGIARLLLVGVAIYTGLIIASMISLPVIWIPILIGAIYLALNAGIRAIIGGGKASGGTITSGMTLVGEKGPELVSLPKGSRVHSNAQSKRMGGGVTNNVTVQVQGRIGASDREIRDIAKKVGKIVSAEINRTTSVGG